MPSTLANLGALYAGGEMGDAVQKILAIPKKISRTANALMGVTRDAIRLGQYQVGPPYIYQQSFVLAPNSDTEFAVNIDADGTVAMFNAIVQIDATANQPAFDEAFIESIGIGSQLFYQNKGGLAISGLTFGSFPQFTQGLLRRIKVKQGDIWRIKAVSTSADVYRVSFSAEQYFASRGQI